ncbi:PEP-CTERM protein-sorting domain-containing protein [Nitrosovibrio sp. Nv17]|nr:PEP-CTERM protein-sorting domain-containing protein [Nitrosovibrio sp. Nv17]
MIKSSLKQAVAAAVLVGFGTGAHAAVTDVGEVTSAFPVSFNGAVLGGAQTFSDIFTFNISEPNVGSGYSVVNFPVSIPDVGSFGTILATLSLLTYGDDGIRGTDDDVLLKSTVLPSTGNSPDSLSLSWDQPLIGPAYLNITGVTSGTLGGLYSGSISVSPVPETETYAMLLAGLGLMGAVVRRRNAAKRM